MKLNSLILLGFALLSPTYIDFYDDIQRDKKKSVALDKSVLFKIRHFFGLIVLCVLLSAGSSQSESAGIIRNIPKSG